MSAAHWQRDPEQLPLRSVRVLVVDDEELVRRVTARLLEAEGAIVAEAAGGREAIDAVEAQLFDVVLSDIHMPDATGLQVLEAVRVRDLDAAVVLITGGPDMDSAIRAVRLGALDYLVKPQSADDLARVVGRAARISRLARLKREALRGMGRAALEAGDLTALGLALDRSLRALWIAFQPIVRQNGELYALEALMRSEEPALPGPEAILEAAERLGRLRDVGSRTRHLTARELLGVAPQVDVFFNLHALDLSDPALFSEASPLAQSAPRMVLEITERASLDRVPDARQAIARLREQGYRIAIDDFGAGYAGLTAFAQLEPDIAKLDMALIRGVDHDSRKASVIGAMVELCHELGVTVVAEGVETQGERDTLVALNCDLLQGFLFAKPSPLSLCGGGAVALA